MKYKLVKKGKDKCPECKSGFLEEFDMYDRYYIQCNICDAEFQKNEDNKENDKHNSNSINN